MATSFFFYDLETSGIFADHDRIMQFAGQRTDLNLKPIGEPINCLIQLSKDILPDPGAILIHGISPQQTLDDGLSEAEFLELFYEQVIIPDTVIVGFNNIRFDDEFMRYLNFRNLYDPYAWSYMNNISRWDLLDVVRMTRALRPDGIVWPTDAKGANTNRLELLAKANKLNHANAHDALSDVLATIELAKLVKTKQPKLFDYLFEVRLKANAAKLVNTGEPFVYTTSHYPSTQLHTTVVMKLADHPKDNCLLVYDLRHDPRLWLDKTAEQLANSWRYQKDRGADNPLLPVKTMRLNRCPAIAPLATIDSQDIANRLVIDLDVVNQHWEVLKAAQTEFAVKLHQALDILDLEQAERQSKPRPLDARLYANFYSDADRKLLLELHDQESPDKVRSLRQSFSDPRLKQLCSLYLARNFESALTDEERKGWSEYVERQLFGGGTSSRLAVYFQRLDQFTKERVDRRSQVLLEDLKLYGESLVPSDNSV